VKLLDAIRRKLARLPAADAYVIAGDMNSDPLLKEMYAERVHTSLQSEGWQNLSGSQPTYHGWKLLTFDYVYAKVS
jgi:hypothetical protein